MAELKLMTVVGARPQFIKAAVVSRAVARHNDGGAGPAIREEIVHTGQHYDHNMSQSFFDEMEIPQPVVNLAVGSGNHGAATGAMLAGIERELLDRRPDILLVYGDTNSTLAGALAAVKLHVPVAHVEAGLRSFNRKMPEEINRLVTDHVATLLFCPSQPSKTQLAAEGITDGVHVVGDVMFDAVQHYRRKAIPPTTDEPFALASIHRAENTDDPVRLRGILAAMAQSPCPIVLPLHPRTRKIVDRDTVDISDRVHITDPLSYFGMLGHLDRCAFVITDSGGLQKEAFFFSRKCITVRDETEWTELVDCGANRVVGADQSAIVAAFAWAESPLTDAPPLYGTGQAGTDIVQHLLGLVQ